MSDDPQGTNYAVVILGFIILGILVALAMSGGVLGDYMSSSAR